MHDKLVVDYKKYGGHVPNTVQKAGLKFIYYMRQIFAGTPVQNWRITATIYGKLFHSMYGKEDVVATYKGIKLLLPTKDVTVVPSIIGGYFESLELDVFKELSKKSEMILDVGGNIGIYAILASKNSKAKIHSFEPVDENIVYFEKNIKLNKANNIQINKLAVGDREGSIKIYLSSTNVGTHSAVQSVSEGSEYVEVPVTSLDAYTKKNKIKVDLLKVDVEGYDGVVYKGATSFIKKQQPTLFAEYAPIALKKSGYEPKQFLDEVLSLYEDCYLFDEKKNKLKKTTKSRLLAMQFAVIENLVLTSNPEHKKILERFTQ